MKLFLARIKNAAWAGIVIVDRSQVSSFWLAPLLGWMGITLIGR